jgi:MFS family permease
MHSVKDNLLRHSRDPKWLVLILAGMGTFMATLDVGIVTVALPTLTKAFKITPGTSQWFALAYTFAITVLLLTFGKIGDLAGRKFPAEIPLAETAGAGRLLPDRHIGDESDGGG